MKSKILLAAAGAILLLSAHTVMATNTYMARVPNGSTIGCATCHTSAPSLNSFGSDFRNNGFAWDARLAQVDSDRDGFANGEELGDPAGTWTTKDPNPSGPVYNPGDSSSHPSVTLGMPPLITTPPSSQTAALGAAVTFTVVATGAAPLTYQWLKDGVQLPNANSATLVLPAVTAADAGRYVVIVSNSYGDDAARATLRLRRTTRTR